MKTITEVANGYIATNSFSGTTHVAKTLTEVAEIYEGTTHNTVTSLTTYATNYTTHDLMAVVQLAKQGHKIDAIKCLREVFNPRIGLKEAKEIVEVFCL